MKKNVLWMLVAILTCNLSMTTLTSCKSDDDNNKPAAPSLPMYSSRAVYTGNAFLAFLSSMFFTVPSENDFTQNTSRMVSAILSNVTDWTTTEAVMMTE